MKKKIFKSLIILVLFISLFIVYFSTLGVETKRFNNQISKIIKNLNDDLIIELNQVKLLLDPFNLKISLKTVGSKFKIEESFVETEIIETNISIKSIINSNFSLTNLNISTKSLEVKNLISFVRKFKNTPELYFLDKILKGGYLISNINLEFDKQGKVKDNYEINGFIKDARIKSFKNYKLDKINLIFDLKPNFLLLEDTNLLMNNITLQSEKIVIKNLNNNFLIEGFITNKDTLLEDKKFFKIIKNYFSKLDFENIDIKSKNKFSFKINNKFEINDLQIVSELKLNSLKMKNNLKLEKYFPNIKKEIDFNNHLINIDFKKDNFTIKGKGSVLFQDNKDDINYIIKKRDKSLDFEGSLIVNKNPINLDLLQYEKELDTKAKINLKGTHFFDETITLKLFSLEENKNKIIIDQLIFGKNFQVKSFKKINLNYIDKDFRKNQLIIKNENKIFNLTGSKFNANSLIDILLNSDDSDNFKLFKEKFNLNIKLEQVFLDKEYTIKNLTGKLNFDENEILNGELTAEFSQNKKLKFTVKTNQVEKVTTLFLDEAEPIVSRYKFIKGFKEGSFDFYSSKKGDISNSNLKIYNFRLKELPILTKLLTLASLQGIADILSGEGITFDEFEMNFNKNENLITIEEMYAIGPAISILMDGYVEKNKLVSLRGSLVPATTINKAIGNIPVLGKILVGSKTGEGVFGVSFKIKGPPRNLDTTVNPIKTLTPRFITRTLEKIKKN